MTSIKVLYIGRTRPAEPISIIFRYDKRSVHKLIYQIWCESDVSHTEDPSIKLHYMYQILWTATESFQILLL